MRGKRACVHLQVLNLDQDLVLAVLRMKMRRVVILEIHINDDSVELADRGHQINSLQIGTSTVLNYLAEPAPAH